jgi:hypothetical protein
MLACLYPDLEPKELMENFDTCTLNLAFASHFGRNHLVDPCCSHFHPENFYLILRKVSNKNARLMISQKCCKLDKFISCCVESFLAVHFVKFSNVFVTKIFTLAHLVRVTVTALNFVSINFDLFRCEC